MASPGDNGEYEPLTQDDNTEVKRPIGETFTAIPVVDLIDLSVSPMPTNTNHTAASGYSSDDDITGTALAVDPDLNADMVEYYRLINLSSELPAEMFVNQILIDYKHCDIKLENMRLLLFDSLKQDEEFPFDIQSELKRRFSSRKKPSDSVAVKLAHDIHTILSVMEGAEFSSLTDLISASKKRGRSVQSVSASPQTKNCQCKAELSLIKDSVSTLQADMLLMKQRHIASENMHVSDVKTLQSDLSEVKLCMSVLENKIVHVIKENNALKVLRVTQQSHGEHIEKFQDTLLNISFDVAHIKSVIERRQLDKQSPVVLNHPSDTDTGAELAQSSKTDCEHRLSVSVEMTEGDACAETNDLEVKTPQRSVVLEPSTLCEQPYTYAEVVYARTSHTENVSSISNCTPVSLPIPTRVTSEPGRTRDRPAKSNRSNLTFALINSQIQHCNSQSNRNNAPDLQTDVNNVTADNETDDFEQYVRKRTKRFYVGGFLPSITEEKIGRYVSAQGPKVTNVSIFRNKTYNSAVIRVNVEDDENASLLVDDRSFWPRGIICRPWMPKNRHNRRYPDRRQTSGDSYKRAGVAPYSGGERARSSNGDFNPYSVLNTEVD